MNFLELQLGTLARSSSKLSFITLRRDFSFSTWIARRVSDVVDAMLRVSVRGRATFSRGAPLARRPTCR